MYKKTFFENVLRLMALRCLSKNELHRKSGINRTYIADLLNGKLDNPTIEMMERIAEALRVPLPALFIDMDSDAWTEMVHLLEKEKGEHWYELPEKYKWVLGILPEYQAFQVKQWQESILKKKVGAKPIAEGKKPPKPVAKKKPIEA